MKKRLMCLLVALMLGLVAMDVHAADVQNKDISIDASKNVVLSVKAVETSDVVIEFLMDNGARIDAETTIDVLRVKKQMTR